MKGSQRERSLLWKELKRRLLGGQIVYKPVYWVTVPQHTNCSISVSIPPYELYQYLLTVLCRGTLVSFLLVYSPSVCRCENLYRLTGASGVQGAFYKYLKSPVSKISRSDNMVPAYMMLVAFSLCLSLLGSTPIHTEQRKKVTSGEVNILVKQPC